MIRIHAPLFAALLLVTAPLLPATSAAAATAATVEEKVVYHINDSATARAALANVNNHLNAAPEAKIVVVTHGKGIDFLLFDAKDDKGDFASSVAGLKAKGVDFRVCANTLKNRKIEPSAVLPEASIVPSGVAEIGKLQAREGYVYLKP